MGWYPAGFQLGRIATSKLFHEMRSNRFFYFHAEEFALPTGAVSLASGPMELSFATQAFCYGENIFAFAARLEITPALVDEFIKNCWPAFDSIRTTGMIQRLKEMQELTLTCSPGSSLLCQEWLELWIQGAPLSAPLSKERP